MLRPGVRFHDGSAFTADAVVWNLDKLLDRAAPPFDLPQATQGILYTGGIARWRKIDESTVEITTKVVDAVLPYSLASVFMSSPARWEEMGRDWNKVAQKPSGTGPWMLESVRARERAELVRNPDHWDRAADPEIGAAGADPDAGRQCPRRRAPVRPGRLRRAPPPDAIPRLRQSKMQIVTRLPAYLALHAQLRGGLAVPRRAVAPGGQHGARTARGWSSFWAGLAAPARGMIDPGHPWFGKPTLDLSYNPDRARALLAEAGFGKSKPFRAGSSLSPAGSGQMRRCR